MSEQEKENKKTVQNKNKNEQDRDAYKFIDQTIKKRPVNYKAVIVRIAGMLAAGVVIGLIASLVFSLTQPALRHNTLADNINEKVTIPPDEELQSTVTPVTGDDQTAASEMNTAESLDEGEVNKTAAENPEDGQSVTSEEKQAAGDPEEKQTSDEKEQPDDKQDEITAEPPEEKKIDDTAEPPETEQQDKGADGSEEKHPENTAEQTEETVTETPEGLPQESEENAIAVGSVPGEDPEKPEGITLQEYRQLYRDMMEVAEEPEHALVQVIGVTSELDYFNQNYENRQRISGLTVAMTDTDLFILTEYRVVEKVERIQVVFCDGSMCDATFQKADQNTGLAVIKVPLDTISEKTIEKITVATLGNSNKVQRGDPVLAVGSPLGFTDSIAFGIVTSTGSKAPVADVEYSLLNTDIEGSPDGSGVLIDLDGNIIGIISNSFGSNTGCITGLAISQLKEIIEGLSNNEEQNYAGILGQDVTQDISERTGIPRGVLVTEVVQDSPAMLAGIKEYDVIVGIGGQQVNTMRDYHKILRNLEADEPVSVTAMRRGKEGYAEITFEMIVEGR